MTHFRLSPPIPSTTPIRARLFAQPPTPTGAVCAAWPPGTTFPKMAISATAVVALDLYLRTFLPMGAAA